MRIDGASKDKVREFLDFAPFTEVGQWNMMRSMYNANKKSAANYVCLMTYRDEQNRMSIYIANMKNSFQVAPDLLILRSSRSSFGGLFSSSSERVVRVPHVLTPQDLQQLLDYFDLIALNRFMKLFGKAEVQVAEADEEVEDSDDLAVFLDDLEEYRVKDQPEVEGFLDSLNQGLDVVNKAFDTVKNIFSSERRN